MFKYKKSKSGVYTIYNEQGRPIFSTYTEEEAKGIIEYIQKAKKVGKRFVSLPYNGLALFYDLKQDRYLADISGIKTREIPLPEEVEEKEVTNFSLADITKPFYSDRCRFEIAMLEKKMDIYLDRFNKAKTKKEKEKVIEELESIRKRLMALEYFPHKE